MEKRNCELNLSLDEGSVVECLQGFISYEFDTEFQAVGFGFEAHGLGASIWHLLPGLFRFCGSCTE